MPGIASAKLRLQSAEVLFWLTAEDSLHEWRFMQPREQRR